MSKSDYRAIGAWDVRGGSITGSAHLRNGDGREDAYWVEQSKDHLMIAVADGCSSDRFAALGAALAAPLAVQVASRLLSTWPAPVDGPQWMDFLAVLRDNVGARFHASAVKMLGALRGQSVSDFNTTLVTAVVSAPWVAVLAIGNGTVVARSAGEHLDLLLPPYTYNADSYGNSFGEPPTKFVTTPGLAEHARLVVGRIPDLDAIAVCTDGMDEVTLENAGGGAALPSNQFYRTLFQWTADRQAREVDLLRLLIRQDVESRSSDDRTIVLAVKAR